MRAVFVIMLAVLQAAPALAPASAQDKNPDKSQDKSQERGVASYPKLARDGYTLTPAEADGLEASLKSSPDDLAARARLLGFYFRGSAMRLHGRDATIEARRRHILWLIAHHPESEVIDLSEATIDRTGHALADQAGYDQASRLWIEHARRHEKSPAILGRAARFFQLSDKDRTISLLRQAQHAATDDREWSSRIGYVYALAILGVDMINQNGLPTSHNPAEANGAFAMRAIDELKTSSDAVVVGTAGTVMGQYGLMLTAVLPGKFTVDYVPLSEACLIKAQELEPANPQWSGVLEKLRTLRSNSVRQPK